MQGHTHEDIDQRFSRVSGAINNSNVLNLTGIIRVSYTVTFDPILEKIYILYILFNFTFQNFYTRSRTLSHQNRYCI